MKRSLVSSSGPASSPTSTPAKKIGKFRPVYPLHLDPIFFPHGLEPGDFIEVKGPSNIGKTYLLSYFVAMMLSRFPTKKAVLINTSYQFAVENVVKMLHYGLMQPPTMEKRVLTEQQIKDINPAINEFLKRFHYYNCLSLMDLIVTAGNGDRSAIYELIQNDPEISLIVIDTIDNYSFSCEELRDETFDILQMVKKGCGRVPTICSTIGITKSTFVNKTTQAEPAGVATERRKPYYANVAFDTTAFNKTVTLSQATPLQRKNIMPLDVLWNQKIPLAIANISWKNRYERVSYNVPFSIYVDMLWCYAKKKEEEKAQLP